MLRPWKKQLNVRSSPLCAVISETRDPGDDYICFGVYRCSPEHNQAMIKLPYGHSEHEFSFNLPIAGFGIVLDFLLDGAFRPVRKRRWVSGHSISKRLACCLQIKMRHVCLRWPRFLPLHTQQAIEAAIQTQLIVAQLNCKN